MKDLKELIDEWIFELDESIESIRSISKNWWWLDSGEKPFVRVNVLKLEYKRKFPIFWKKEAVLSFMLSDLLPPYVALEVVKENLEKSKNLKWTHFARVALKVKEDTSEVFTAVNAAKEANRLMDTLASLLDQTKNLAERKKYERIIRGLMNEIIDTVTRDYRNWSKKKAEIEKRVNELKAQLAKAPARVEEKVERKEEVVKEEELTEVETA